MTQHFVYDEYHHLTGFQMLFPDGDIKAAFLLTSLSTFTDREFRTHHLRQLGLRHGADFMVVNASDVHTALRECSMDTVPQGNSMRGKRTVLAMSGVLQLVLLSQRDFGRQLRYWLVDEVLPAIMLDGYVRIADTSEQLQELRYRISILEAGKEFGWDATLGDLAGGND